GRDRLADAGRLLRDRRFVLMLASVAFVQAAHGFYYAFSTLIWRSQGISPAWSGLLWGLGVAVEVAFLWLGEPIRRRLGPERLLIFGAAGSVVRWGAFAFSPPLWLLFPLQALHALSFTATFVASLELTDRLAPKQAASSAQSLNAALSFGLMSGLATLISGPLYDHFGAYGYLAMAGSAAIGLVGALKLSRARPAPMASHPA
ncbi:MFS transporter, partial [Mycobacterium tuberculosis]